jgi:hypothetical protein
MSKPLLLSLGSGKVQELIGTAESQVPVWDDVLNEWRAEAVPGGGGGGGVTSVGLTGGTSGIVIGSIANPILTTGTFELNAPLRFAWNTATPTDVAAAGQVAWNTDEGTLDLMFEGGNVKSVLGQTLHQRVLNDTGASLAKGVAVYVNGAQGNRVTVALAQANADSTSATIIGIIAHAIVDEAEGYVITEGVIKGVNTGGYTEGLPVYLSPTTPGALTQTKPEAPQHLVLVGYCVKADATTGEILVKTQNGYELGELHDVKITTPSSGQILVYDATVGQTRWENASLGSSNGVAVTAGPGSLSVGLDSTSSPTLTGLTLSGLTGYLKGNGASALSASATVPTSDLFGSLLVANLLTQGAANGVVYRTSTVLNATAAGLSGQYLKSGTGIGGAPVFATISAAEISGLSGTYAPLASPAFTGVPTAPTAPANTNTTQIATTAFVLGQNYLQGSVAVDLSGSTGIVAVSGGTFSAREVTNSDISASAGINRSKIEASSNAYRVVANGSDGKLSEVASTGTAGQYLSSGGSGALPAWASIPYDLSGEAVGSLSVDQVVFHFIAPRAFTMTALSQAATATTVMKIQVNGVDASYPQAVTTGQTVTAKITTAGTDVWFTVTGNI